ncbi:MAG: S-layer homology domain-containing protein [Acidimicrobiia bacterium]|nr:S-layer homology domain-containing protein [Acidimicrobiia bacterium]
MAIALMAGILVSAPLAAATPATDTTSAPGADIATSAAGAAAGAVDHAGVSGRTTGRASIAYPHLSGPQFLAIFDQLALPDTTPPTGPPPPITGNAAADDRIRLLAERRGYSRRPQATGPFGSADGLPMHPRAAGAYHEMKAALAAEVGVQLRAVSAYRSVDDQRRSFLSRLSVSPSQIAAGQADGAVDSLLAWVAPPGYSKHQTGYAVDVVQGNGTVGGFEFTAAFRWLAADNYRNARRFGFLPSYPPDGGQQGPNPEPWEYVFVGTERSRVRGAVGSLDAAHAPALPAVGRVRVRGWAVDADSPGRSVGIHVYVGGPVGTPGVVGTNLGPATAHRPDVGAAYSDVGDHHGFDALAGSGMLQGRVPVCVYALGSQSTRLLGCPQVDLLDGSPFGSLDAVEPHGERALRAAGWAIDPDGDGPVTVRLELDGVVAAEGPADRSRPDVGAAFPWAGSARGFVTTVDAAPGNRRLCVVARNHPGSVGVDRTLGCAVRWVVDPDAAFRDLLSTAPFHDAIAAMADAGVIGGFDDGTFRPTTAVSRQAAVAFLWRLAGSPAPEHAEQPLDTGDHPGSATRGHGFSDVGPDHPFADPITWAAAVGIISGYDDGTFRPTVAVTRQALAALVTRWTAAVAEPLPDEPPGQFTDVDEAHPFAAEIAAVAGAGLATGYDDGTFRPTAPLSRQAAAAVLWRLSQRFD